MTTIFHDDDADLGALDGSVRRGRRLRQPGPLVGAEPARLRVRRARLRAGRRVPGPGGGRRLHARRPRRRERRRRGVRPRARRRDPVAAAHRARPTASRSSRAATRSRSTASSRAGDVGMVAPRMLGPEVRLCYEEGIGFITAVGVHRDVTGRGPGADARGGQGHRRAAPGRDRADARCRRRCSTSRSSRRCRPALTLVNGTFVQVMLEHGIPLEAIDHRARALGRGRAHDAPGPRVAATPRSSSSTRRRASTASSAGARRTTSSTSARRCAASSTTSRPAASPTSGTPSATPAIPDLEALREQHAGAAVASSRRRCARSSARAPSADPATAVVNRQ